MSNVNELCAFILTHGRPDRVITHRLLRRAGFTGRIYIVIDDEDDKAGAYHAAYGKDVKVFSKKEVAKTFDEGDNFEDRRTIVYARNACFELAKKEGYRYFIQLDDDYSSFHYRFDKDGYPIQEPVLSLDDVLVIMLDYFKTTPFLSIAMGQGGDYFGGLDGGAVKTIKTKRKAMNTFMCDTERPFKFIGRINEDVNTYTATQRSGGAFLTLLGVSINQMQTQSNAGGMTDIYLDSGTYIKSFYTVMYAPSCTKITDMGRTNRRLHHKIKWDYAAPKIISDQYRKSSQTVESA